MLHLEVDELPSLSESLLNNITNAFGVLNTDRGAGGRNNILKGRATALLFQKKSPHEIVKNLLEFDIKNHDRPLFSDENDPQMKGHLAEDNAYRFVISIKNSIKDDLPKKQKLIHINDFLDEPDEEVDWLVDGLLSVPGSSAYGAKPKVGKTTTTRDLIVSVAKGRKFLGRECKKSSVLSIVMEGNKTAERNEYRKLNPDKGDNIYFRHDRFIEDSVKELRAMVKEASPRLVVIDTAAKFLKIGEISDYGNVIEKLTPITDMAEELNFHVMFIFHSKKKADHNAEAILGSTAITGAVDTIIIQSKDNNGRRHISTEQRYGEDLEKSTLIWDPDTGRLSLSGNSSEEKSKSRRVNLLATLRAAESPLRVDQFSGNKQSNIIELKKLFEEGVVVRAGVGKAGDPYLYSVPKFSAIGDDDENKH